MDCKRITLIKYWATEGANVMFHERLKLLRESYHWDQTELAKQLGVSKQSVSNWENSNILPSIDMLTKVAELFHVSTDFLLGLDNRLTIDVTGLRPETVAHLQSLINIMQEKEGAQTTGDT